MVVCIDFLNLSSVIIQGLISGMLYSGIQTRFAQTCGFQAEYNMPSIKLLNLITLSKIQKIHTNYHPQESPKF